MISSARLRSALGSIAVAAALAAGLAGLVWLDRTRAGPVNAMERCNLLLARADAPAADVLLVGSSRLATAVDPVAIRTMLSRELGTAVTVDRLALGRNPLRAMHGLLAAYLENRGTPRLVVLEAMVMSRRSMARLAKIHPEVSGETVLYRRDVNLLEFARLLGQPAVAMPFTRPEGPLALWSHRLRGVVQRAGALVLGAARLGAADWRLADCGADDWTRERSWAPDFAFALDGFQPKRRGLDTLIAAYARRTAGAAREAAGTDAPAGPAAGATYPYELDAPYRQGERVLLRDMIRTVRATGGTVLLTALPVYGHRVDRTDFRPLLAGDVAGADPGAKPGPDSGVALFVPYDALPERAPALWYDDAHLKRDRAAALTTALTARRALATGALGRVETAGR
jgi:hypothetical protein